MSTQLITARTLAPEDILPGTYIMVMSEQRELLHPANPCEGDLTPKVARVSMRPTQTQLPRLVLEVNLPFVVVKNFERKTAVLDIRAVELARVSKRFAKVAVAPYIGEDALKPEKTCPFCEDDDVDF